MLQQDHRSSVINAVDGEQHDVRVAAVLLRMQQPTMATSAASALPSEAQRHKASARAIPVKSGGLLPVQCDNMKL